MVGLAMQHTHDEQVASLLRWYGSAGEDVRAEGRRWYSDQREVLRTVANENALPLCTVAAVTAALSPMTRWQQNLAGTIRLLRAWRCGEDSAPANCTLFHKNAAKAWAIVVDGADPADLFTGSPKVMAFWRNLCGDESAVTIDTWMLRAVDEDRLANQGLKLAPYRKIAEAVVTAAEMVGETPAEFQAIVWLQIRGELSRMDRFEEAA
jgi:hypothetical protein